MFEIQDEIQDEDLFYKMCTEMSDSVDSTVETALKRWIFKISSVRTQS